MELLDDHTEKQWRVHLHPPFHALIAANRLINSTDQIWRLCHTNMKMADNKNQCRA